MYSIYDFSPPSQDQNNKRELLRLLTAYLTTSGPEREYYHGRLLAERDRITYHLGAGSIASHVARGEHDR